MLAIVAFAAFFAVVSILYHYWTRPPQMGASDEVFATVDALFTAVTAQDEGRLKDCEARLKRLEEAGELPTPAWKSLNSIIQTAKAGKWRASAESLYQFIQAQRREGSSGSHSPAKKPKGRA
ncbi:MAG: hypothetical protein U0798_05355 [Gemmataceae bacterium]